MNILNPRHQPQYIEVEGATGIVIFIHGIAGSPYQFNDFINQTLNHGFAVSTLLLPGHGGTTKDFARTPGRYWNSYVKDEIDRYRNKYNRIILVGHSLGTLLSFISYIDNPQYIGGIIALNSPLKIYISKRAILNNLRTAFYKELKEDDPARVGQEMSSIAPGSVFSYIMWLPRIIELFRLKEQVIKQLRKINIPLLIVHTDKDELVSRKSLFYFRKYISAEHCKIVNLPHSYHYLYIEEDKRVLLDEYCSFIKSIDKLCVCQNDR